MTVGNALVANVLRQHSYDILVLRRLIKHCVPAPTAHNAIWQMDLTGKHTSDGVPQSILGLIDFGSRVASVVLRK